jgi:release factor glutamine methyltransferase
MAESPDQVLTAADIATGSGCIAVTLVCEEPRLRVVATDISLPALRVARENADTHTCSDRIQFLEGTFPDETGSLSGSFHVIVSNPPYISMMAHKEVDPSVDWYEPPEALYAPASGHSFYFRLFSQVKPLLKEGGSLVLEIGSGTATLVQAAETAGWVLRDLRKDLAGHNRCVVFQAKDGSN